MQNNALQTLLSTSHGVLEQLHRLALSLSTSQYTMPIDLLGGNTIGKHYRHIIEFYQCLLKKAEIVNYDKRLRNTDIENSPVIANAVIEDILMNLNDENITDMPLQYHADFSETGTETISVNTSFGRELAYNIEHAIHHMAILQMVVKHYFKEIELEEGFGVAASTLRYQQQNHVHSNISALGQR
ncbi:MAG: DinB family protein [Bacteroidota bacterium]